MKLSRRPYSRRWYRGASALACIGAGVNLSCHQGEFLCPHISRGLAGAAVGGAGAMIGGAIGALLPWRTKELIYSAK